MLDVSVINVIIFYVSMIGIYIDLKYRAIPKR